MTYNEKKKALENIKIQNFSTVDYENIGTMFLVSGKFTGLLDGFVCGTSIAHGLDIEVLLLDSSLFVGTKEHALSLKEALGGKVYQTEHCRYRKNPRDLWVWEGPQREEQCRRIYSDDPLLLDKEEIKEILF